MTSHVTSRQPRQPDSAMHFAIDAVACNPGCTKTAAAHAHATTPGAVGRCITAGLITAERDGRSWRLTATPAALDLIHPGTGRPHRDDKYLADLAGRGRDFTVQLEMRVRDRAAARGCQAPARAAEPENA